MSAPASDLVRKRFARSCLWIAASCCFRGCPEIIRDYMDLFGPAKLPPKWAFGPWISANHWDSQEKVERAVAQAEEHGFPVCALVAEAWSDEATFMFSGAQGMFPSRMAAHSGWRTSIFPIPLAGSRWYGTAAT